MTKKDRIQHLLITHLLNEGQITIDLPNSVTLQLGITKEGKHGIEKADDYCWIIASDSERSISMDSYNLGLQFPEDNRKMIFEDSDGATRTVSVV